ncbi:MAG: hypothetical protein QM817_07335 [Archangium sp.]
MKTAAHQYEDKLLEFAYGELARPEADAVEAHVRGCQRCAQALDEIRGVRATMAQLPMVAAPDAGLDSLLAYAEQAAKRNAVAEKPATSPWRRFLAPLVTVLTLVTVGVVGFRAKDEFDTSPANAAADAKLEKMAEEKSKAPAPVVAVAPTNPTEMPAAPQPHPAPKADEQAAAGDSDGNLDAKLAKAPEPEVAELNYNTKGGKSAPQSATRRAVQPSKDVATDDLSAAPALGGVAKNEAKPDVDTRKFDNNDSMNAGAGFKKEEAKRDAAKALEATKTPPPPPPAKETVATKKSPQKPQLAPKDAEEVKEGWTQPSPSLADKTSPPPQEKPAAGPSFGLGTGGASTGSSPAVTEAESESTLRSGAKNRQEAERRRAEDEAQKKEVAKQALDRQQRENAAPPPAVANAPSTPPAQQPAPAPTTIASSDGKKTKSKESYSLGPLAGSTSSSPGGRGATLQQGAEEDSLSIRPSANARADNDDANKMATQRAQFSGDAIESARLAANRGDRQGEIQFALKALQSGATGSTRAEALSRICEAYEALGESSSGDTYCNQLLKEFPTTAAAQRVADRRNAYRVSPKKAAPAAKERQKAYDLESVDEKSPKPADAAPAQSY